MPAQITDFQAANYDLIFLDFADGTDYIQRSAMVLEALIDQVNAVKDCNGDEIVVIGASMGGQIARFTLTNMEQNGKYHGVRTYVSFDSPHQGAVVPMGVQATVWGLAHLSAVQDQDPTVMRLWEGLDAPGARQLLYETFLDAVDKGIYQSPNIGTVDHNDNVLSTKSIWQIAPNSLDYSCIRNSYMAERSNLGYPSLTRNVAVINGSKQSINQGFLAGDTIVQVYRDDMIVGNNVRTFEVSIRSAHNFFYSNHYTSFLKLPESYLFNVNGQSVPNDFHYMTLTSGGNSGTYDNVPGCMQTFTGLLVRELEKSGTFNIDKRQGTHCFMPSISTLDINTNNLFYHVDNYLNPINPNPSLTPFEAFFAPDTNEYHVQLTSANRAWLNNELTTNVREITSSLNTVYNFGGKRRYIHTTVAYGGQLLVNNNNHPVGFANSGNPNASGFYEGYVNGCGVTVEDGGLFSIGSVYYNDRAEIRVAAGSKVHIKKGGTLRINGWSKLIVEEGGELILEDGALVNYWANGTGNAATLRIEGTLTIVNNGNAATDIAEILGSGRLQVAATATVDFETGAHLKIEGDANQPQETILEIEDNSKFGPDGDAYFTLNDGKVTYGATASIIADNGASFISNQVIFEGNNNTGILMDAPRLFQIADASFDNFEVGIDFKKWH